MNCIAALQQSCALFNPMRRACSQKKQVMTSLMQNSQTSSSAKSCNRVGRRGEEGDWEGFIIPLMQTS